jgi:diadenosine tetraphosphatase ApaH/serine/threonine PP2A family protein phosphatase
LRYALVSDIHSNLEALTAVADDLKKQRIDKYLCLGDVVGYAASPNESIEVLRDFADGVLLGNHDSAAVGGTSIDGFNPLAQKAISWTAEELTQESKEYLQSLPETIEIDDCLLVHSSPSDPLMWRYIFSIDDARMEFHHFSGKICLVGHSHQPLTFIHHKGSVIAHTGHSVEIEDPNRYIINVGSVGQPRDLDPRAAYGLYDTEKKTIEIRRVEYDVNAARAKIVQAGLPHFLGDRLLVGR